MVLARMRMSMKQVTQTLDINVSVKKTHNFYNGKEHVMLHDLQLRGQTLKQVEKFTYLGSVFFDD